MNTTEPTRCNDCHKVHAIHCDNCACIPCLDASYLRRHAQQIVDDETRAHESGNVTLAMQDAIVLLTVKLADHVPHFNNRNGQDHDECVANASACVIATLPLGRDRSARIATCLGLLQDDTMTLINIYIDAIEYAVATGIV